MQYRRTFEKQVFYPTDRVRVTAPDRSFTGVVLSANARDAVVEPDDGTHLVRCSVGILEHLETTDDERD